MDLGILLECIRWTRSSNCSCNIEYTERQVQLILFAAYPHWVFDPLSYIQLLITWIPFHWLLFFSELNNKEVFLHLHNTADYRSGALHRKKNVLQVTWDDHRTGALQLQARRVLGKPAHSIRERPTAWPTVPGSLGVVDLMWRTLARIEIRTSHFNVQ